MTTIEIYKDSFGYRIRFRNADNSTTISPLMHKDEQVAIGWATQKAAEMGFQLRNPLVGD